ncbi:MAG: carotenoid biosynthesis protein [Ilumatobacteraceae bacterium]
MTGRSTAAWRTASAVVTGAAMIGTPLAAPRGAIRRVLASVVVTGLGSTTLAATTSRWGARRALASLAVVATGTGVLERVGTQSGRPFGAYGYSGALRPEVAGVPAIVPVAWFAMAVPAREAAHGALGRRSSALGRVVVGAAALTAWDLFLDPQMVGEGYWRWERGGRYRGIPWTNFAGWFLASTVLMGALEVALPVDRPDPDPTLVAEYGAMSVMETLGFAAFFRDRLVAVVGGAAMLPIAGAALWRCRWRGR